MLCTTGSREGVAADRPGGDRAATRVRLLGVDTPDNPARSGSAGSVLG